MYNRYNITGICNNIYILYLFNSCTCLKIQSTHPFYSIGFVFSFLDRVEIGTPHHCFLIWKK